MMQLLYCSLYDYSYLYNYIYFLPYIILWTCYLQANYYTNAADVDVL